MRNVKLEGCLRRTDFDEDQFVRFYPYLPHLMDLSIDIIAGIQRHPDAPKQAGGSNRSLIRQSLGMLVSDRTRLADQPVGVLVSIDKIYELVEPAIPPEKQKHIVDIRHRFDNDDDYPGMAGRVAKAICLMEFVKTDLPCTANNIAALLIQDVTQAPPIRAVRTILHLLREAHFIRETKDGWRLYDLDELRRAVVSLEWLRNAVGTVNPRLPGRRNDLVQFLKRVFARSMGWYIRPLQEFHASVNRSIEEIAWAVDYLSANMVAVDHFSAKMADLEQLSLNMVALEERLAVSEKGITTLADSMHQDLDLLHEQVEALPSSRRNTNSKTPVGRALELSPSYINKGPGKPRTCYVVGLFGTGRQYINDLMRYHIGERARYFRDTIRLHPGPTPMIYSGHATMRHVSRAQQSPAVMSRILEAVRSGYADLIFVYRHPLDSLLTNWIWWRTFLRDNKAISGISEIYKNSDDLRADLEQHFFEFKAFAEGDPDFFAAAPGPRFLSFAEFVEETELHLQSANTLALRLEDFMIDPVREFSKIAAVLSLELNWSRLCLDPPRTKAYGYLALREKAPRFRNFIDGLDAETKSRIEKIGYHIGGVGGRADVHGKVGASG
jgi:hypothetical protein